VEAPDFYEILEVTSDATPDAIRAAYRRLAQQVHPDKQGSRALFRQVQTAYETLSDPGSRAQYDRDLLLGSHNGAGAEDQGTPGWRRVDDNAASSRRYPPPPPPGRGGQQATRTPPSSPAVAQSPPSPLARNPSAFVLGGAFALLILGLDLGKDGIGLALLGFVGACVGAVGLAGHRRATERERLRRAGMPTIDLMSGREFEQRLVVAFQQAGFQVRHVGGSRDFGTDLILDQGGVRTVVQAKRWAGSVGQAAVREAAAARAHYGAQRAMVVTNSLFTPSARALAASNKVELWDRGRLSGFIAGQLQAPVRTGMSLFGAELQAGLPMALRGAGMALLAFFETLAHSGASRRRTRRRR